MKHFTVSTECPSCGALLDFTEGVNALRCLHCMSNLLVTGRKRVLSYYVPARLNERLANALAVKSLRDLGRNEIRGVNLQLYFVPYYHMTGQDLTWEIAAPRESPVPENGLSGYMMSSYNDLRIDGTADLIEAAGELFGKVTGKMFRRKKEKTDRHVQQKMLPENIGIAAYAPSDKKLQNTVTGSIQRTGRYLNGDLELRDRYLDKNFLACDLKGQGIYSLGVRPSVLRLQLFRKEALPSGAKAVKPLLDPEKAEAVAMKKVRGSGDVCRQVVGKVLSLIYFPFWVFDAEHNGKRSLVILDAVSKSVIRANAPETLYTVLNREIREQPEITEFRRLVCPNCGWDLPVRPDDCIFCCRSCKKAWLIVGSLFHEVPFRIAAVQEMHGKKNIQLLPFWVFKAGEKEGRPFDIFVPAFRYRRLRYLVDLSLAFTRLQPSYSLSKPRDEELSGVYYDLKDGLVFAKLARSALTAKDAAMFGSACSEDVSAYDASLTWFPFSIEGNSLGAPFCKLNIPKNLIL
jgi:DNA-directed RNA polymerase subunit RPC12/RpoP